MRRSHLLVIFLVLFALLGADAPKPTGGTITGTVAVVDGRNAVSRDDVYIYLEDVKRPRRRKNPGEGLRKEIRQVREQFKPDVLVVPVGTVVAFPNYDRVEHNVFSPTSPPFDLGRHGHDKRGKEHKFEDTDEFTIFCDIHSKMMARVKVVDSPFIRQVKSGEFTVHDVPAGTYKVVAWVPNSIEVKSTETVTVTAGGTVKLGAELHLQLTKRSGCHDRKDGTPYDKYAPCPRAR